MKTVLSLLALLCLTQAAGAIDAPAEGSETQPAILKEVGIDQRLNHQVPLDLVFRKEQGQDVRLGDCLAGKPTILVMAYYRCPKLCNQVLNGLLTSLNHLDFTVGKEVNVVVVSFDATEDSELAAAKKRSYLERYGRPGAEAGWHFLTGQEESIIKLARAVGFRFRWDPFQKLFAHDSGIILLTPEGKVSCYFFGISYEPQQLKLGLVAASQNEIGSLKDHILLACYRYDPTVGRYTPWAMGLVRMAGVLTVVVIVGVLGISFLRENRRRRKERQGLLANRVS